ncbi:hypothetical protein SCHPADRAFT_899460 [Schizopora paradoxa]|uniref:Tetratricopeptide repeat protein 39B n=1 Tax=Schizopora paradoxa TaxID=27342 RepID=A0A0H2S3V5_9AGAM|nr:hypothetical protein SCHPADRAFT_899460 [Schizopora paradoxa]
MAATVDPTTSEMPAVRTDIPPLKMSGLYTHGRALEDLPGVAHALALFMASHMIESEQYCHESDPKKERLYFASGYGLIQCVKALMSYEDDDLLSAIGHTRHGNVIAQQHRKKSPLTTKITGFVTGSTSGVNFVKSMTPVERHAELIYAETLFEKALLGIVYSGDWLAFIKEALNLRTTFNTYRQLQKYVAAMDAEACERGEGPEDTSIDVDFRSGVYLGAGLSNIILTLLPGRLLSIIEIFGYKGDRMEGLKLLYKAGGWTSDSDLPKIGIKEEGVRRTICDMALLIFHLVLSSFTFEGVDVLMAQKILDWNLRRYPNGVFFLFGQGRLQLIRGQPALALESYDRAMKSQDQYANLHQISYWEMATSNLSLWKISESLECWRHLYAESSWSKAIYTYGIAVCLLQLGGEERKKEAETLLEKIPSLQQRIAGKSIPMEKFVARKARKYKTQNGRLLLPALEFGYFYLIIARATRSIILSRFLPIVREAQEKLNAHAKDPKGYEGNHGYWDDLCLATFLEGVCLRYVAYPDRIAIVSDEDEKLGIEQSNTAANAMAALQRVLDNGSKIELDHQLVYYSHYEIGRLSACMGDKEEARNHFNLVLSGKPLEINASARKGKYSMESALMMRTQAAMDALEHSSS